MKYIIFLLTIFCFDLSASTLVVGGGPAGLAVAIEAAQQKEEVLVLEMRPQHTRRQSLSLTAATLDRLQKWGVELTEMTTINLAPNERMGLLEIQYLEKQMAFRAKALGVQIIHAKCVDVRDKQVIAVVDGKEVIFSYDILVAADGTKSVVREKLGILLKNEGKAHGIIALIPAPEGKQNVDVSKPIKTKWGVIRRFALPSMSLIFMQNPTPIFSKDLAEAVFQAGWKNEGESLAKVSQQPFLIMDNIHVHLQRAITFANPTKHGIVIGDAAGCASFFQGMGANTALETAEIAGRHLKQLKDGDDKEFNVSMDKAINKLLEDSRYLFEPLAFA